ncbi:hypothetical protein [Nakamurella sp.]|uniref:hypothetical protein n=1 Tax=Nakamurella sp. TaxID=1869182 RepID=UPI0037852267
MRASSQLLVAVPAQDPDVLGVGAPINEVLTIGDVRCLSTTAPCLRGRIRILRRSGSSSANEPDPG